MYTDTSPLFRSLVWVAALLMVSVATLTAQGIDPTFGNASGHFSIDDYMSTNESVTDLAIDSQRRFLIAFRVPDGSGGSLPALMRLLPNGRPDTSFGFLGFWFDPGTPIGIFGLATVHVAVDSADRPIVAWTFDDPVEGDWDIAIQRVTTSGSSDYFYHLEYDADLAGGDDADVVYDLLVLPGDRVVAIGEVQRATGDSDFGVHVLSPTMTDTWTPDTAFSGNGWQECFFDLNGFSNDYPSEALFDGSRLVVVGAATTSAGANIAVCRLDAATGALDTTFDGDGRANFAFQPAGGAVYPLHRGAGIAQVFLQGYVIAGAASDGNDDYAALLKITSAGGLDTSFNSGTGWWVSRFAFPGQGPSNSFLSDLVLDLDGTISAAGYVGNEMVAGDARGAIVRLLGNGAPDTEFAAGGVQTFTLEPAQAGNPSGTRFFTLGARFGSNGKATHLYAGGEMYGSNATSSRADRDIALAGIRLEDPFFEDGFESGDTTSWSSTTP